MLSNLTNNFNFDNQMRIKLVKNKLSIKEIVSFINHNRSISKKEIYNYCLSLKDEK